MFYSNDKKIADFSQGIKMSNGMMVNHLATHWSWTAMRYNNYLEPLFTQEKSPGTLSINQTFFTSSNEFAIEGDIVTPKTSRNVFCFFQTALLGNGSALIGLGEAVVQGGTTLLSGIYLQKDKNDYSFITIEQNTIVQYAGLDDFNGDADAIAFMRHAVMAGDSVPYCILWDTYNKQASLFLVRDNTLQLLHMHKPQIGYSGHQYILQKQYCFTAYGKGITIRLDSASLLVSPYTYLFTNTFSLMPSALNVPAPLLNHYVAVVVGMRSTDRVCVDLLSYSVRQVTPRNASINVIEYKTHHPAIFSVLGFGTLNFHLYSGSFQGTPPALNVLSQDRIRHSSHIPNNNIDVYTHNEVIKNVCRSSAAVNAETLSFKRTFCAITVQNTIAPGGQVLVNSTFAEY
ncbi:MAG: hypothetical protein RML94_00085 [Bacteroidia bacterium]|nr:hypothetical protein [Bacteroidia bacterium]